MREKFYFWLVQREYILSGLDSSRERKETRKQRGTGQMVEENKTEEKKSASAEDTKVLKENRELKKRLSELEKSLLEKETNLQKAVREQSELAERVRNHPTLAIQDGQVTVNGVDYDVVEIDTAHALIDKVRKSFVQQDAPVAVLRRR